MHLGEVWNPRQELFALRRSDPGFPDGEYLLDITLADEAGGVTATIDAAPLVVSSDQPAPEVPPRGFAPGAWEFVLRLDVIDPSAGSTTTVITLDELAPIDLG